MYATLHLYYLPYLSTYLTECMQLNTYTTYEYAYLSTYLTIYMHFNTYTIYPYLSTYLTICMQLNSNSELNICKNFIFNFAQKDHSQFINVTLKFAVMLL